jgi:hypothetical protein
LVNFDDVIVVDSIGLVDQVLDSLLFDFFEAFVNKSLQDLYGSLALLLFQVSENFIPTTVLLVSQLLLSLITLLSLLVFLHLLGKFLLLELLLFLHGSFGLLHLFNPIGSLLLFFIKLCLNLDEDLLSLCFGLSSCLIDLLEDIMDALTKLEETLSNPSLLVEVQERTILVVDYVGVQEFLSVALKQQVNDTDFVIVVAGERQQLSQLVNLHISIEVLTGLQDSNHK